MSITQDEIRQAFIDALKDPSVASVFAGKSSSGDSGGVSKGASGSGSSTAGSKLSDVDFSYDPDKDLAASNKPGYVSAIENAKKATNIGTAALGVAGNVINSTLKSVIDTMNDTQEALSSMRPEFETLRRDMGGISQAALEGREPLGVFANNILGSYEEVVRLSTGSREAISSIKLLDDPNLLNGANPLEAIFVTGHEAAKSFMDMMGKIATDTPTLALKMSMAQKEEALALKKTMQITDEEMSALLTKQYAFTGETGTKVIQDIANVSVALSKKVGVTQKSLQADIIALKTDTQTFGDIGVDAAGRIAASLSQLGLSVQTLKGMVGKFLDFDSAAGKMGELSALFGIQMDAMEMTYLANEDQEEFLQRMREQVLDSGVDVENMSNARARALSDQMGMSVEQMKMFLRDGEQAVDQAGLEQITDQAATMDGMTTAFKEIGDTTAAANRTAEQYTQNLEMQLSYAKGIREEVALQQGSYERMSQDIMKVELPMSALSDFKNVSEEFRTNSTIGVAFFEKSVSSATSMAQTAIDGLSDSLSNMLGLTDKVSASVVGSEMGLDVNVSDSSAAEIGSAAGQGVSVAIAETNEDLKNAIYNTESLSKADRDLFVQELSKYSANIEKISADINNQEIKVELTLDGGKIVDSIIKRSGNSSSGSQTIAIVESGASVVTTNTN